MDIRKNIWNLVADLLSFPNTDIGICMSINGGKTIHEMKIIIGNEVIEGEYTIIELLHHLRLNFKNPNIEVKILLDEKTYPISLVGKKNGKCAFLHYSNDD